MMSEAGMTPPKPPPDALTRLSQIKGVSCEQRDLLVEILEELRSIRQLLEKRTD
jgi:hypothetical protein